MFELDYEQLIAEKRVYFVTYGRGGTVGIADTAIDDFSNSLTSTIRDAHTQAPQMITKLKRVYDSLIIELENDYEITKKVRIQKIIPFSQVTFEAYELIDK